MINVEIFNSQDALRPSNSGYCALGFENTLSQYENLEILYYPKAPDTSILCSTGEMTAVSTDSIIKVLQQFDPPQTFTSNLPICLIKCYSNQGVPFSYLFRFAIHDPQGTHNHQLITSSQVYCSIHNVVLEKSSVSRHLSNRHKNKSGNELNVPPSFSITYQFSQLLYWQIHHQISHNAIHSSILRHGIFQIPPASVWDKYYDSAYECTKAVIIHEIEIAEYVSIFIDGWTNNNRFEGIRLSFFNYGTLINRFLSMMFLNGKQHTAENIVHSIQELDKEYHFLKKAIWFVSDCANVNQRIAEILKINFVPCGAHRFMICFQDFDKNCWIQSIITWLSSLSRSSTLHDRISVNEEIPFNSLLSFSETRWMYRYQMIERAVQCKHEILNFGISNVSMEDLEERFTQMQEFLDAFSEYDLISKYLQKENILIHEVFLLFCKAMEHTNYLSSEFESGKLQFLGEDNMNPFEQLSHNFQSRFFGDSKWADLLIGSFLLNGNFEEASWLPEEQYIIAAEQKIKDSIGDDAYEDEYIPFRADNPNGVIDPFSFWINSPFKALRGIAQKFLILIGTNCKLESDFSKGSFILSGKSALSVTNFNKRAVLKLNDDIVANLLVFKTPELLSSLSLNEQSAYQLLKDFKTLNPDQHPFPDPDEIKERYGESAELKIQTHLKLLTNLQRRLQYHELSRYVSPINNISNIAIPSTNIRPPHLSPFFTKGKHQ